MRNLRGTTFYMKTNVLEDFDICISVPLSANPKNGQAHSNNSLAVLSTNCLRLFDHFVGLALKGLTSIHPEKYVVLRKLTNYSLSNIHLIPKSFAYFTIH